jgi:hypothetical protein
MTATATKYVPFPRDAWKRLLPHYTKDGLRALHREILLDAEDEDASRLVPNDLTDEDKDGRLTRTHTVAFPVWAGDPALSYEEFYARFPSLEFRAGPDLWRVMDWIDNVEWPVARERLLAEIEATLER